MAKWYFDDAGDLKQLSGKTVGIFGYGNQGRAQAHNMRDAGVHVIVGSRVDQSSEQSIADGFETFPLLEAARRADILFVLVPDEIMPQVYKNHLEPALQSGNTLNFASGYNIYFKKIVPRADVNVIMLAPRMVGQGVRDTVVEGRGYPSLVAVHQDATGDSQNIMLALAKAIGTTKMGCIESSFEEETIVDLFNEHFGFLHAVRRGCEVLVEAGCSPEAAILELYASGEMREVGQYFVDYGLFEQLKLHSRTSQYGQLIYSRPSPEEEATDKNRLHDVVRKIKDGTFAREWTDIQENDPEALAREKTTLDKTPIMMEERQLYEKLGRRKF